MYIWKNGKYIKLFENILFFRKKGQTYQQKKKHSLFVLQYYHANPKFRDNQLVYKRIRSSKNYELMKKTKKKEYTSTISISQTQRYFCTLNRKNRIIFSLETKKPYYILFRYHSLNCNEKSLYKQQSADRYLSKYHSFSPKSKGLLLEKARTQASQRYKRNNLLLN